MPTDLEVKNMLDDIFDYASNDDEFEQIEEQIRRMLIEIVEEHV